MRKIKFILSLFFALSIGTFCWHILSPKNADWLKIETPSGAIQNQQFNIRITLLKPEPGMYLSADLHWLTGEKISHGFLSGITPVKITGDKTVYDLSIPVKGKELEGSVSPVVFISSDGTWSRHTKAAEVEPVPVLNLTEDKAFSSMDVKSAHDITKYQKALSQESASLRFIVAGIWFAVAAAAITLSSHLNTKMIAVTAAASALWEVFNISIISGKALRYIAWIFKAYYYRREPQLIITVSIVIIFAMLTLYLIISQFKKINIIIWISFLTFWTVSLLRVLSLHEIDSILSKTFAGFEYGQIIRLTASSVSLSAIFFRFFTTPERRTIRSD